MANPIQDLQRDQILQNFFNEISAIEVANLTSPILLLDRKANIESFTPSAEILIKRFFNTEAAALESIFQIIPTDLLENFSEKLQKAIHSGFSHISIPSRKINSMVFSFCTVYNLDGGIKHIQVFLNEEIQEELKSQKPLRKVLDNAGFGIIYTGPEGEILNSNKAARSLFGHSLEEFQQIGYENLFKTKGVEREDLKETLINDKEQSRELIAVKKDGSFFPVKVHSSGKFTKDEDNIQCTLIQDISREKLQEKAMDKTLQTLQSLYANHPDAVYSFDLEGNFLDLNESAARLIETSVDEMEGKNFISLIPKEDRKKVATYFYSAAQGMEVNYNIGFISKKGTKRLLNVSNFPIITEEGISGIYGIARDITDAETRKQEVVQSRKRLKKIMDQSLDIICTIDEGGKFHEVSAASERILGYKPRDLVGTKFMNYVLEEDWQVTENMGKTVASGEDITNFSNRYIKKDGDIVPISWSAKWDDNEGLMYCVARDASALKNAEMKIQKERSMLKAIIDNIPDHIFVVDRDHRTILTNRKFYSDYLGKNSEAETLGLQPVDYFAKEEGLEVMKDNKRIMESQIPVINRKDIVYDHSGNKEVILLTKVPLTIEGNDVSGLVGIARDITATHNLEQEQEFIYKLIDSLATATTFHAALGTTLEMFSNFFNFEAAEAWEIGYDKNYLFRVAEYHKKEDFWKGNTENTFRKGTGLPGRTWKERNIQVWEDIGKDPRFIRKDPTVANQLDLGIGVPIIFEEEVLAVLTFFGKNKFSSGKGFLDLLARVATQISTEVRRKMTENRLNNMYRYSPNLIAVVGIDGFLKKINPAFVKMFGYTEEELLNTPFTQFLHQEEKNITYERLKEVAEGRSPQNFQNRCLAKNGEWKWISWTPAEFLEEEGIVHIFGIDITSIKSINLELHKYKNIIESSKDAVGLFTLETKEIFLNSSFKSILGYGDNELKGQEVIANMYEGNIINEEIFPALLAGQYWEGDLQIKNINGELFDYYLSAGPVFNSKNEIIAIFGVHTDISERKKYENTLKRYSEKINGILESITDGFFSLTYSGVVTHWNKAAETLLGISRNQIEGKNIFEVFPESRDLLFFSKYEEARESMKKVSFEEFSSSHKKWFEVNVYPAEEGFSVYFKDITDRKLVENKVRIAKERYDLVAKATREAVYDWDITKNELEWSEAYYEVYGLERIKKKENISQWLEIVHPEDKEKVERDLNNTLRSGDTQWDREYRFVKKNNKIAFVLERGFIIRDEAGIAVRMIGSLQDITELKQNERALEELNHKLQQHARELATSNAELEQFAYIASHDLQEPLRMVTSFLSQLQKKYDSQLDDRARQYIHFATDGAVRMRQILLDLLEYSRAGRLQYTREDIDINDMLQSILQLYETSIKDSGAIINYRNLPVIKAAATPLQRVLSNLISNAIKYSRKDVTPVIEIDVEERPSSWEFKVSDNGIGINERYFEKIFILFQRLHSREEFSGTGIGLAICKKIIENHGGKIWLKSKEGKGSTFHFTINKQF